MPDPSRTPSRVRVSPDASAPYTPRTPLQLSRAGMTARENANKLCTMEARGTGAGLSRRPTAPVTAGDRRWTSVRARGAAVMDGCAGEVPVLTAARNGQLWRAGLGAAGACCRRPVGQVFVRHGRFWGLPGRCGLGRFTRMIRGLPRPTLGIGPGESLGTDPEVAASALIARRPVAGQRDPPHAAGISHRGPARPGHRHTPSHAPAAGSALGPAQREQPWRSSHLSSRCPQK